MSNKEKTVKQCKFVTSPKHSDISQLSTSPKITTSSSVTPISLCSVHQKRKEQQKQKVQITTPAQFLSNVSLKSPQVIVIPETNRTQKVTQADPMSLKNSLEK